MNINNKRSTLNITPRTFHRDLHGDAASCQRIDDYDMEKMITFPMVHGRRVRNPLPRNGSSRSMQSAQSFGARSIHLEEEKDMNEVVQGILDILPAVKESS
ncbi:predicted protein [Chaetoceros tenuissimus]|uniref:Uncharacterized protein n=1 Tax=Chaetoceros tenuissimus TaxID=426638 RepID=A0AAD3CJL7_9STRA|nr:predicted protein [Chaetoceros tenuissimus]